jgi:hypothetical protein
MPGFGVRAARLTDIIVVTTTIQAAIDAAEDGDTISIPAAFYFETLTVDKSLTLAALAGPGGNMATIQPAGNNRIITVQPGHDLVLKDLRLLNGFYGGPGTNEGGAVYIQDGTLTIDNCLIHSNSGNYGGAIRQAGTGEVIVQNGSEIYWNHALVDGGGIAADGSLSLNDFTLWANQADRHGGGASVLGDQFTALRGTVNGNVASQNGGGVNASKSVTVDQVEFVGNSAGANGGGILQWNGNDVYSVVIQHSTFEANKAGLTGGALSVYQGATTTISQSQFEDNEVDTQSTTDPKGGAVYFSDTSWGHTLTVDNSSFSSNSLKCTLCGYLLGGGLYAQTYAPGAVILNQDSFLNNDAWMGGGFFADRATINRTTFQGNTAGYGGGAYLTGASQIEESAFLQNSAVNAGGGLFVDLSATSLSMGDTKFIGNAGGFDLGGAMLVDAQTITMINVAVADTLVNSGGAIEFSNPNSTISLFHMTVNDTHLWGGARTGTFGIHIKGPDIVNIWNSMITNHRTGVQIDANSACLLDHTLWFGNAYNIAGAGSSNDISPISSDPAYAVDRYHLTSASGAIDSGVDRLVYHDIDGDARDNLPDVGADEFRVRIYLPCIMR